MAHFARIVNGIVTDVIVADEGFFTAKNYDELGYRNVLGDPSEWLQTSYNTRGGVHYDESGNPSLDQSKALRKNFAAIGSVYDSIKDAFIFPKPYPSWLLNETTCLWEPPVAYPSDGKSYTWNEKTVSWVRVVA
jgi:hypothetical protein